LRKRGNNDGDFQNMKVGGVCTSSFRQSGRKKNKLGETMRQKGPTGRVATAFGGVLRISQRREKGVPRGNRKPSEIKRGQRPGVHLSRSDEKKIWTFRTQEKGKKNTRALWGGEEKGIAGREVADIRKRRNSC